MLKRILRYVRRRLGLPGGDPHSLWPRGTEPSRLTDTQALFCEWNAERLGITVAESRRRYASAWAAVRGGHAGQEYRAFCVLAHELFRVFHDDTRDEVFGAYQFHAPMHFLRMLSYPDLDWSDDDPLLRHLSARAGVTILDFGCGLAQKSRRLAAKLRDGGQAVALVLADIPTDRKPFLLWLGERQAIATTFLDCTPSEPIPPLGSCDVCIATEVFEHLHEPLAYLEAMHRAIGPGGLLLTNVADQKPEYMHVSPDLGPLRRRLAALGYVELVPNRLYRKPSHAGATAAARPL